MFDDSERELLCIINFNHYNHHRRTRVYCTPAEVRIYSLCLMPSLHSECCLIHIHCPVVGSKGLYMWGSEFLVRARVGRRQSVWTQATNSSIARAVHSSLLHITNDDTQYAFIYIHCPTHNTTRRRRRAQVFGPCEGV